MKIIAKPIGLPSVDEITKENISKSQLGQKLITLIEEGIENKFLAYKSVNDCLKKFCGQMQMGTCYGQASAVIIADHHTHKDTTKQLVENASKLDVICYQIFSNLEAVLRQSVSVKRNLKKIENKLDNAKSKEVKKLKKEKNNMKKLIKFEKEHYNIPIKNLHTKAIPDVEQFCKKISHIGRSILEEKSQYTYIAKEQISFDKTRKFIALIKKLQQKEDKIALRVLFFPKNNVCHAVTFFPTHRLAIYDANKGLVQANTKKEFVKHLKQSFNNLHHKSGEITVEIFKMD